jgi:hypothetical protein
VAGGRAAGIGRRGGDRIPALRASRVRAVAALAALAVGGALGTYPITAAGSRTPYVEALAAAALLLLTAALVSSTRALVWALAVFGAAYFVGVLDGRPVGATIAYGGALLLLGELAAWSSTLRAVELVERAVVVRKLGLLALIGAGGAGTAALTVGAARIPVSGGLGIVALGLAAAVAAIAVVSAANRIQSPGEQPKPVARGGAGR